MAEIKLSELDPVDIVPDNALVYVVIDGVSYRTTKEKLIAQKLSNITANGSSTSVTIQSPDAVNANDLVNLGQVEEMISEIPTPILFTTDASLYLDPITNELRANTGLSTENFEYASGVQEFTLVDEPSFVISLMLNLVAINNPLTDYSIDGKKLTILKPIEPTDKINITYQFIITI